MRGTGFVADRVAEDSIWAALARDGDRLFGDEMFADLFTSTGHRSVPPRIVTTVMVLRRWCGMSDREAVAAFEFDARFKFASGGLAFDSPGFAHTVVVDMCARLARSDQPRRIFDVVLAATRDAGVAGAKRALDSAPLYDAVATQDTVTMIRSAICQLLRRRHRIAIRPTRNVGSGRRLQLGGSELRSTKLRSPGTVNVKSNANSPTSCATATADDAVGVKCTRPDRGARRRSSQLGPLTGTTIVSGVTADVLRLRHASDLGTGVTVDVDALSLVEVVKESTDGTGAYIVVDTSARAVQPVTDATGCVSEGGTLAPPPPKGGRGTLIEMHRVVRDVITIVGARYASRVSNEMAFDLLARDRRLADFRTHVYPIDACTEAARVLSVAEPERVYVSMKP